jgi:hypothetical protein
METRVWAFGVGEHGRGSDVSDETFDPHLRAHVAVTTKQAIFSVGISLLTGETFSNFVNVCLVAELLACK